MRRTDPVTQAERGRPRLLRPALVAAALALSAASTLSACGDDSGSDAGPTTTDPVIVPSDETVVPDDGFDDDLVQTYVDLLAAGGLASEDALCIGVEMQAVMEDQAVDQAAGDQAAEDQAEDEESPGDVEPLGPEGLAAYEEQCGVTPDALLGASLGGLVAQDGGSAEEVACAVAAGAEADPTVMTEGGASELDAVLETCGVSPG